MKKYKVVRLTKYIVNWLTNQLTNKQSNSVEESRWESCSFSASSGKSAFHAAVKFIAVFSRTLHLSLYWDRLIQSKPRTKSYRLKIHFNIILLPANCSFKWSLSLRFLHQNPVWISPLPHMCCMPRPTHSSWFGQSNNIWRGVQS
jgi:hypothetical protein